MRRPAANVVHLPGCHVNVSQPCIVDVQQVVNEQHVTYLLAIAIDGDGLTGDGGDDKPSHPSLILDAHLSRAVDATLAKNHRWQAVDAGVVARILVSGSLRTPVGRKEVERLCLRDAEREVAVGVAGLLLDYRYLFHPAVDFVCGGIKEDGIGARVPRRLQRVEGTQRVVLEVGAGVRHRGGDRRLAGQVHDNVGILRRLGQCVVIAHVAYDQAEGISAVLLAQPGHVGLGPPAREVIVHRHPLAPAQQPMDVVAADEAGSTRDQVSFRHPTSSTLAICARTQPRERLSRASPTRPSRHINTYWNA